jgi:hypothetical protein
MAELLAVEFGYAARGGPLSTLAASSVNRTKRLTKRTKGFFVDPGLAAHLSGLHRAEYPSVRQTLAVERRV